MYYHARRFFFFFVYRPTRTVTNMSSTRVGMKSYCCRERCTVLWQDRNLVTMGSAWAFIYMNVSFQTCSHFCCSPRYFFSFVSIFLVARDLETEHNISGVISSVLYRVTITSLTPSCMQPIITWEEQTPPPQPNYILNVCLISCPISEVHICPINFHRNFMHLYRIK